MAGYHYRVTRDHRFHARGCWVDGGLIHPPRCPKCNEHVEDRIEHMLGRLDKQAGGNW